MTTILLLLSISPFFLGKANSEIKYGKWRPHFPSDNSYTNQFIFVRGASKCHAGPEKCVSGPALFPIESNEYRPKHSRHRRPYKESPQTPDRQAPEIPDEQVDQTPEGPSPWIPNRQIQEIFGIPKRPCPGSDTIRSRSCVRGASKCQAGPEKCVSGPASFPIESNEYRPKPSRHRRPCKENPQFPDRQAPEIPEGPSPWIPNRQIQEKFGIPDRPCPGSDPIRSRSCECGISTTPQMIIKGDIVDPPYKYPWMAALQMKGGETFCGSSIISEQYILTAGHCVAKGPTGFFNPSEIQVAFVSNTKAVSEGAEIMEIIPHPQYNYMKKDNDIALVKLKERIHCSIHRRPICLPKQGMHVNPGKEFIIAGWGSRVGGTPDVSPQLMETRIQTVEYNNCHGQFRHLEENFYCLHGLRDSSPCHGDSGGPMFNAYGSKFYVLGVASMHNSPKCDPNDYFVYTKVPNYVEWINSYTNSIS